MAAKKNDFIDTINTLISRADKQEILHLTTEDNVYNGKEVTLKGEKLTHFGSCSYLGLETDIRLKKSAIKAINDYGVQFSSSRTYLSCTLYEELQILLEQLFGTPAILFSSTSLGHHAVIPLVIADNDAVIIDHQAHASMQDVMVKLRDRNIPVTMVRHSRMDELEDKITNLSIKHDRVWYFFDGIYSMYGDPAPLKEIDALQQKHKKLHLYVDDAHGMSWAGPHGGGYVLSKIKLNDKMILGTSLSKAFASAGAAFIIPDKKLYKRVSTWGGPLTYSGPQQPALLGASIASARIHLSPEIHERQYNLIDNIRYCNQLLREYALPIVSVDTTPIFFIGLGLTNVGYNMVKKMLDDGCFVNLGMYPAVPETCTGIRFTLTVHHTKKDIEKLIITLKNNLPVALKEEGRTQHDIYKAFRKIMKKPEVKPSENREKTGLLLEEVNNIYDIDATEWDHLFGNEGLFDYNGMAFLQEVFCGNTAPEHNWQFYYFIVRDHHNNIVMATAFTKTLIKDDMLFESRISTRVETQRKENNPYWLSSYSLTMGTLLTDGHHLYIDNENPQRKNALTLLLDRLWELQESSDINAIILRDFYGEDHVLSNILMSHGFTEADMPDTHYHPLTFDDRDHFLNQLNASQRRHVRKDILAHEHAFQVTAGQQVDPATLEKWYALYLQVQQKSTTLNTFPLPFRLFENINSSPHWDILQLHLKNTGAPIAVSFSYKNKDYTSIIPGLDYNYRNTLKPYKQLLFQVILRAKQLGHHTLRLGMTASLEKRKLGAVALPKKVYIRSKDHFQQDMIHLNALS